MCFFPYVGDISKQAKQKLKEEQRPKLLVNSIQAERIELSNNTIHNTNPDERSKPVEIISKLLAVKQSPHPNTTMWK